MKTALMILMIILGILLVISIMPQDTKSALPTSFGGEGNQTYFKPKGKQAFLSKVTKVTSVLFFINALALLMLDKMGK
ncbi:MAG: preprotein translocase subunit SecG [Clostridioides sp.]|jgi:preprotein translocase subunit SecG|nr:preprotein translocase subunit SecG [Clostridioides sp.]